VAAPAGTTPSKQTVPSAKTVDTQSVLKRYYFFSCFFA